MIKLTFSGLDLLDINAIMFISHLDRDDLLEQRCKNSTNVGHFRF